MHMIMATDYSSSYNRNIISSSLVRDLLCIFGLPWAPRSPLSSYSQLIADFHEMICETDFNPALLIV